MVGEIIIAIGFVFFLIGIIGFWLELVFNLINFGTVLSFVKFAQCLVGEKKQGVFPNDNYSNIVLISLGVICLLTGVLGSPFIYLLFGKRFEINIIDYLIKVGIWALSFALSILIYKFLISKAKIKDKVFDITFNTMGMFVVVFFVAIFLTALFLV